MKKIKILLFLGMLIILVANMIPSVLGVAREADLYLTFDNGTFADSYGNFSSWTDSSTNSTGIIYSGRDYSGASQQSYMTDSLFVNGNIFSINMWVYLDTIGAADGIISKRTSSSIDMDTFFSAASGTVSSRVYTDSGSKIATTTATIGTGGWHMLTILFNGGISDSIKIFIDTVEDAGGADPGAWNYLTNTSAITRLGNLDGVGAYWFDGRMDEIGIWRGYNLNSTEISQLYNSGAPNLQPPFISAPAANTSNFTVLGYDAVSGDLVYNFSLEVNGENYSTSNGSIVTNVFSNHSSLLDLFFFDINDSGGYYNKTYSSYNVSVNLDAQFDPLFSITAVSFSGNKSSYVRNLNYSLNISCPSWSNTNLILFTNNSLNSSSSVSCNNETQKLTGSYIHDVEGSFNLSFKINTSYNPADNNKTTSDYSFISDLYNPNVTLNLQFIQGFANPLVNVSLWCNDTIASTLTYNKTFNGVNLFYGNLSRETNQTNQTAGVDGLNNETGICSDLFGSTTKTLSSTFYSKELCLVDERTGSLFSPSNLTRAIVYYDDNSSYFDFKSSGVSCTNFSSSNEDKLRFDFGYLSGDTITRYIDVTLVSGAVRVCTNTDPTTHYEQLFVSASSRPAVIKSVFANCLIGADYTRFAYQDALILKAFSIETLYYLYTFDSGAQVFLASLDGSISTYVNLDTLEFQQAGYSISIFGSALTFTKAGNTTERIDYYNQKGDNTGLSVSIEDVKSGSVLFSNSEFTDPNNVTFYFDFSTLAFNESSVYKITAVETKSDGSTNTIKRYFNPSGQTGSLDSGIALTISVFLLIFGFTFAAARITFSWFGIIFALTGIVILSLAIPSWTITFMMVLQTIVLVFTIIVMISKNQASVG